MPKESSPAKLPRIGAGEIRLLEQLCTACAVSGDEGAVRRIVLEHIQSVVDEVKTDALGNVLAVRRHSASPAPRLKVMLAAHMDEVGLMITGEDGDGIYRFDTVGGLDARHLVGKPVFVGSDRINGVIGAKPIHLTTASERKSAISMDSLRIDITGEKKKPRPGDRATFATAFARTGPSIRARALDNRVGVATLITLLKDPPPGIDLQAAFTVQEEVGLRGARVAAYAFDPDIAIALDCSPAHDLPTWDDEENARYNTRLDGGPAIYIADGSTLSDPRLIRHFSQTAESLNIPYQFRQAGGGGTDAGGIQRQRAGIPSISISVPGRYLHTAASLIRLDDWQNTLRLLVSALGALSFDLLQQER